MSNGAQIDTVTFGGNGKSASGSVAARLLQSGFNVQSLRTNDTLRKDEWKLYDTAILEVARKRLVGVADLMNNGLRFPIQNALGVTRVEWETVSDMNPAEITMSGISQSQNDRVNFELTGLPLPIVHKDFNINIRALEASRKTGQPLDMTQAQLAARIVTERIETMLFKGFDGLGSNNMIYGYLNAPYRNTGNVTASWMSATGEQMVDDLLAMIGKAVDDNMYGPYMVYVPAAVFVKLGDDFKANSDRTIIERLKAIPGIIDIKPSKDLEAPQVVLVQLSSDVVDMIDGIQPMMVQWESHGGMIIHFKVMAIMIPRVRADQTTQSGLVQYASNF